MNHELSIQKEKLELIQWLSTLEDKSIIEKIKNLRKAETKDWWDTISEEEKESIQKGIKEANEKKLEPHSNARKIYELAYSLNYYAKGHSTSNKEWTTAVLNTLINALFVLVKKDIDSLIVKSN